MGGFSSVYGLGFRVQGLQGYLFIINIFYVFFRGGGVGWVRVDKPQNLQP